MKKIPRKTITRVLLYIRTLEGLLKEKRYLVSSKQLSEMTGLSDVKIRKDISNFKSVGKPRIGYRTLELKKTLQDFLLQSNTVHLVLFGAGNLGSAILKYPGFQQGKIRVVAAFDVSRGKIGRKINGVRVYPVERAPEIIKRSHADIGIIAVPKEHSQEVADYMVLSGLHRIVNFAPCSISVPAKVQVRNMDFTIEFLSLFCDSPK
ncbi:MAG TPA: redox-sensing transcriptional repressor Rex [Candidatus Omnitrophota bacterium]|nr:redox-sensing transcriptional repressor Rex [Candidatus Omnitrophota bacterium]HPS37680.1 redox-sensing transcriptional repressor Rex [Candidatus Omnitrophota bacterium]